LINRRYLYLLGIISCFIGEVFKIRVFGLFELYPLRVVLILAIPFLIFSPFKGRNKIWQFATILFFIMLIYGITSLIWSPDPGLGLRQIHLTFVGIMIFFIVSRYAVDSSFLKKIMIVWSIMSILSCLLGFYEMFNGEYLFSHVTDGGAVDIESTRILNIGWLTPRVFLPGPNEYAFFNSISALLLIGWAFQTQGIYKVLAIIATILSIVLIINSFSRAAISGFLIGVIFFIFILTIKSNILFKLLIFIIISCISLYIIYNTNKIIDNNLALSALTNKIENDPNEVRSKFYATAIFQGTIGTLGFGRGLGASTAIIDGSSYHLYLLEILAEFGFWILLAYLTLIFKICIQLWRSIQKGNNVFWSSGILASCIAFPLLCTGPASLTYVYPYWLWLAFIIVYTDINSGVKTVSDT
jgi:hypothetical protein